MTENVRKSECCDAEVRMEGVPDFVGGKDICTVSFVCNECGNACNILPSHDKQVLSCYLAGYFVPWGQHSDWRDFVLQELQDAIRFYDPRVDTDQGSIAMFISQDLAGVESCDCVFYFLTKSQGDVGAAIECTHAHAKGKLVILCIDQGLGFVHPFLLGIARRVLIGMDAGVSYLSLLSEYGLENEFQAAYKMMRASKKEN